MKKGKTSSMWGSFFGTIPTVEEGPESPRSDEEGVELADDGVIRHVSGISDNVVEAADRAQTGGDVSVVSDGAGKIKFKKAKKLTKKVGSEYSKALNNVNQSRFQDWSKMEMVLILVGEGVELRNESGIERGSLRELCEALYFEKDMPSRPPLPTLFDIIRMNAVARRIQNMWVIRQCEKRQAAEHALSEEYIRNMESGDAHAVDELGFSEAELLYMAAPKQMIVGSSQIGGASTRALETDNAALMMGTPRRQEFNEDGKQAETPQQRKPKNILDIPWVRPNNELAIKFSHTVQPRKGGKGGVKFNFFTTTTGRHCCLGSMGEQLDLWEEGQISEFGIYGSGVTNYFKFIKWCAWLFCILSIIAIPIVVLNDSGPNNGNTGLQALARTTAGNLLSPYVNGTDTLRIPGCNSYGVYNVDCELNKVTLATFYSILDIVIICVAFIAFMWLRRFEVLEERTLEKNTVNASMFTLTISSLPPDLTEEELVEHLNTLCPNHKIANVSMAYDNAKEIEECIKRGDIIRAKIRAAHEFRHYCTKLKEKLGENPAQEKIDAVEVKILKERGEFLLKMAKMTEDKNKKEHLLAEFAQTPARPIFAFVTFDRAAGREACLHTFNGNSFFYNYMYNQNYKLKGKWLKLEASPDPSTILWENLAYDKYESGRRRLLTSILALLMIFISLALIFSAKYLDQVNSNQTAAELCPSNFGSMTEVEQRDYVEQNPDQLSCYCNRLDTFQQSTDSLCQRYLERNITSQVLTFFASLVVLVVNVLIERVLKYLSAFEKHNSEDARGTSIFLRMFILKYINTTLVFFINNNSTVLKDVFGVDSQTTTEFTADWFNTIGVTIVLVQLGDIFSSHSDKFYRLFMFFRKKRIARTKDIALTQDDLNMAQIGPEFEFAFSYAQLLSTFYCCFTFSTGIPILYAISATNFLTYYFVEKYMFIHLYRIPPLFSNNVGKRATAMLPYAFIIHLFMSIWVLSNTELFQNNQDEGNGSSVVQTGNSSVRDKLTGTATFPLFVFLLIILALRILTHLYKGCAKTVKMVLEKCCGTRCLGQSVTAQKKKAASAMAVVTYTRAVQRNLIKGLATYNILQNPTYKEAFAITWKFAMTNKSVRNVRHDAARAQNAADESDPDKIDFMQRNFKSGGNKTPVRKLSNKNFSSSFYGDPTVGAGPEDAGAFHPENTSDAGDFENVSDFPTDQEDDPYGRQSQRPESGSNFLVDAEEQERQRQLYLQYQQQHQAQQQAMMYHQQQQQQQMAMYARQNNSARSSPGGRSVNVMPLGGQRPVSYSAPVIPPGYRVVSGGGRGNPYQQVPGGRPISGGAPYGAQVMNRGPVPVAYGVPPGRGGYVVQGQGQQGRGGYPQQGQPGRGGPQYPQYPQQGQPYQQQQQRQQQQGGRRPAPGRPVDNDGFENADHLLYD